MAGAASLAKLSGLWMSDVGTTNPDKPFSYMSFDDGASEELIDTGARTNWGTLSHPVNRVRKNIRRCQPRLGLLPSMPEWERLLQWIQGGTPTTAAAAGTTTITYPLSNVAVERTITHIDEFTSIDCNRVAVDRAVIRGQAQQEIELELDCVGTDWVTPTAYTPTALRATAPSLLFRDLTISIAGTSTYKAQSAQIEINKAIDRERFFNGNVMPAVIAKDRLVTLSLELPWGLHYALWQSGAADGSLAVVLTWAFTLGAANFALAATMPAVKANTNPLERRVPEETMLMWEAQAYAPDDAEPPPLVNDEIVFALSKPTPA
jgi:hypothetical protein